MSKVYEMWIRGLPCAICETDQAVHVHHLIGKRTGKMGGKAEWYKSIPLCFNHHTGDEGIHVLGVKTWEAKYHDQEVLHSRTVCRAIHDGVLRV